MQNLTTRGIDTARRDVRVHQVLDERDGQFSYVLACVRTGAAALVDPNPRVAGALQALVQQHRLKTRYVLNTSQPGRIAPRSGSDASGSHIYQGLLAKLGLNLTSDPDDADAGSDSTSDRRDENASAEAWWSRLPVVRPLTGKPAHAHTVGESLLVQAGDETLGIRVPAALDDDCGWTLGGSLHKPVSGRICSHVRVALGAFHLHVLPLADHPQTLAFACPGALFTGRDTSAMRALAELDPDTLLYPRTFADGQFVGNVAQALHSAQHSPGARGGTPTHALNGRS